jgi:hypothetical protein
MPGHSLFNLTDLHQARLECLREARALPVGPQRNQKRMVTRSLKRLIEGQPQRCSRSRRDTPPVSKETPLGQIRKEAYCLKIAGLPRNRAPKSELLYLRKQHERDET